MKQMKTKQQLSIVEAVDFLSSLAEIDITLSRKVLSSEGDTLHPHRWLDQQLLQKNQEIILEMLASIHSYLKEICEKHPDRWDDVQVCKGVQSLLFLLEEAVEKMEKFTDLFKEDPPLEGVMQLSAYQALQEYIVENVLPHLKQEEEDILGIQEEELVGVQKKGIRDLEDIKGDRFYELFYLKKEDKKPFYDYDMIRRLKLIYDFDQMREHQEEVDSFTRIRQLQNQEFSRKAAWVLQNSSHLIASFYKESMKAKSNLLVAALNKTLMSLMLSANPRNLQGGAMIEDCSGEGDKHLKNTSEYFADFHFYLREALHTQEYKKISLTQGEGKNSFFLTCFLLVHRLCSSYFLTLSLQKEMVSFIRRMIHKGSQMIPPQKEEGALNKGSLWKELLWEDDSLRAVLGRQPNGPVRRVIESFLRGEVGKGWDPLAYKNAPSHLFTIVQKNRELIFLRMPAPLKQKSIQRAEVVEEFENFLRGCLLSDQHHTFLMVNLQNRTSWEEHGRVEGLERISVQPEYVRIFFVVGLPKQTDFYFQRESYQDLKEAHVFKKQLVEQFEGREMCGFHWPASHEVESNAFVKKIVEVIHKIFFGGKDSLTLYQKQDFIEIFYFFLSLKAVDLFNPSYMTFACKDGVDTGAVAGAGFFSCLRMMISDKPWEEEEKDLLLWMLYAPALFFRERAIQKAEFLRLMSAMIVFQEGVHRHRKELLQECRALYHEEVWGEIEIKAS